MTPLVSIIIPVYNAEKFIVETVNSVLNQTLSDFEILIIDDCSTDKTYEILTHLAKKDSRIKLLRVENNMGVAQARNKGLSMARGKWVALLDSDDIWLPEKLERQIKLGEEQKADLVYCSYAIINENGEKVCDDYIVPEATDFVNTLAQNVIGCSTVLLSNELYKKYSFPTNIYHEDYALWLRILKDGNRAVGETAVMSKYRLLQSSRSADKFNCALQRWKIYRDFLHLPFFKSVSLMYYYATSGFQKYKKLTIKKL